MVTLLSCACLGCGPAKGDVRPVEQRSLAIRGTRGDAALALTSDEPGPIGGCSVTIRDEPRLWTARIDGRVQQYQTIVVRWADFRSGTDVMPASVGLARNDFVATCFFWTSKTD